MTELNTFLEFEYEEETYKSSRVLLEDLGSVRDAIRKERRAVSTGLNNESLAILMAQPVSEKEMWDYVFSPQGSALLIYQCTHRVDERFTKEMAGKMVMLSHEFRLRLLVESSIADPTPGSTPSSGSTGSLPTS